MKVRAIKSWINYAQVEHVQTGDILDVDSKRALDLIGDGRAEAYTEPKPKKAKKTKDETDD